jgi:hypothetical protein
VVGLFRSRAALQAEILVPRHQLNVLRRKSPKRVAFSNVDRLVFTGLYRLAPAVLDALKILQPETLIRWHRAGFRAYWRWNSRPRGGRPSTAAEIRQLIREMSVANPLWGARVQTAQARRRADQRGKIHGQEEAATVPRLDDFFTQSRRCHHINGFVHSRTAAMMSGEVLLRWPRRRRGKRISVWMPPIQ